MGLSLQRSPHNHNCRQVLKSGRAPVLNLAMSRVRGHNSHRRQASGGSQGNHQPAQKVINQGLDADW